MDSENKQDELAKATAYASRIYSIRPRSERELSEKLAQKGFSSEIISQVLETFKNKSLLDDKKFARLWVDSRMSLKPKGAFLLRQELEQKGVDQQIIDAAIEEAKSQYNEEEIARKIAKERLKTFGTINKLKAKKRIFDFLRRRGFSNDVVYKVIKELHKDLEGE